MKGEFNKLKRRFNFIQLSILTVILVFFLSFKVSAATRNVYLTFDDGPTFITERLLDVLNKEKVKATFFVVGKEIKGQEKTLKRILEEGHSIGLHTYSHNLRKVYKNDESFIKEMEETSEKIEEITGFSPKIIRFPGGSSKRLNKEFLDKLHEKNFKVFDWNSDIYDGEYPELSLHRLCENSKHVKGNSNNVIILMHCNSNNKNTVGALPKIIKYYKENNYEFHTITESTKEYYYKF